jgi:hypothetical protein
MLRSSVLLYQRTGRCTHSEPPTVRHSFPPKLITTREQEPVQAPVNGGSYTRIANSAMSP